MLKHIKTRPLFLILLFAAILRFGYFAAILLTNLDDGFYVYDSFGYWKIADNLHQYGVFSQSLETPITPDYYRTPLYPLFIYLMEFLPVNGVLYTIFLQNAMSLVTVFYTFKLAKLLFDNTTIPTIAALLLAVDVPSIVFSNLLLTETLFSLLLIMGVYQMIIYFKTQQTKKLLLSSFFIGLAILTRPIGIFIPFVIAVFILVHNRKNIFNGLKMTLTSLLVVLLTVSPWLIRNKTTFDGYFISVIAEHNLQNFQAATIYAEVTDLPLNEARCSLRWSSFNDYEGKDVNKNPSAYARFVKNEALDIIKKHPNLFVKNHIKQMVYFFVKPVRSYIDVQLGLKLNKPQQITNQPKMMSQLLKKTSTLALILVGFQLLILVIAYSSSIFGLIHFNQQNNLFYALFFLSFLLLYSNFNIPDATDARFRLPFTPLITILSSAGIFFLWHRFMKKA